jgi:hypothetical protein
VLSPLSISLYLAGLGYCNSIELVYGCKRLRSVEIISKVTIGSFERVDCNIGSFERHNTD